MKAESKKSRLWSVISYHFSESTASVCWRSSDYSMCLLYSLKRPCLVPSDRVLHSWKWYSMQAYCNSEGNEKQWGKSEEERCPFTPCLRNTCCVSGAILGSKECSSEKIHKKNCPSGAYTLVGGDRQQIKQERWRGNAWEYLCVGVSAGV